MNGLVGHHEALADIGLGPGAHLRGGVLDFTNDKTSAGPVRHSVAGEGIRDGQRGRQSRENVSRAQR